MRTVEKGLNHQRQEGQGRMSQRQLCLWPFGLMFPSATGKVTSGLRRVFTLSILMPDRQ